MRTIIALVLAAFLAGCSASRHDTRASFYASKFEGRKMANGKVYHARAITAASLTYPLNTMVTVTSLKTGRVLPIRITDRGPYSKYNLDLSVAAARILGITERDGWGWVEIHRVELRTEPYDVDVEIPYEPIKAY